MPKGLNVGQVLIHALKDHGAREVFGIPGDFVLPFFKVIEAEGALPFYTLSHEPSVGFAADAAARYNSGLGVVVVTYGAGAFNVLNAVTGAYAEKSPLVVISGGPGLREGNRGMLLHHQAKTLDSQLRIFSEVTCDQAVLNDPATIAQDIARVLRSCREQSRPVYIEIPRDMVEVECNAVVEMSATAVDACVVAACADEIMTRLDDAKSPALLAGVELRRFGLEDKISELARRLGLPVATTFMGRGLLSEPGSPLMGTYMGGAGDEAVASAVEGSDALLLLGVIFSDTNFGVSVERINIPKCIIAGDREVRLGYHVYPNVPLSNLLDALLERTQGRSPSCSTQREAEPKTLVADDQKVMPGDIANAINDLFETEGVMPIASDIGDCLFTAMDILNAPLVAPGYYATMGFGVPAGLGIQATSGQRPLIVVGDGAFQMTGWELGNCRRNGWNPLVVVFNNASWEMLRTFQPETGYNDLDEWDFASIAGSLGGKGYRVKTRRELQLALKTAYEDKEGFQLVEVMLERGDISPLLEKFVSAIKKGHSANQGLK